MLPTLSNEIRDLIFDCYLDLYRDSAAAIAEIPSEESYLIPVTSLLLTCKRARDRILPQLYADITFPSRRSYISFLAQPAVSSYAHVKRICFLFSYDVTDNVIATERKLVLDLNRKLGRWQKAQGLARDGERKCVYVQVEKKGVMPAAAALLFRSVSDTEVWLVDQARLPKLSPRMKQHIDIPFLSLIGWDCISGNVSRILDQRIRVTQIWYVHDQPLEDPEWRDVDEWERRVNVVGAWLQEFREKKAVEQRSRLSVHGQPHMFCRRDGIDKRTDDGDWEVDKIKAIQAERPCGEEACTLGDDKDTNYRNFVIL